MRKALDSRHGHPDTRGGPSEGWAPESSGRIERRLCLVGSGLFLVTFLGLGVWFIAVSSPTSDEATHLAAGYSYLTRRDFRLNPEHPPFIKELCALPVYLWYRLPFDPAAESWEKSQDPESDAQGRIGRVFLFGQQVTADRILGLARIPNLLLGAAVVALAGWWAFRLWGPRAGILAAALTGLDPNLLAHSSLVTTDAGLALFTLLAMYLLWEYVRTPSWSCLLGAGAATGLALASKHSAIMVPFLIAAVAAAYSAVSGGAVGLPGSSTVIRPAPKTGKKRRGVSPKTVSPRLVSRLIRCVPPLAVVFALAALVVSMSYFFVGLPKWWDGVLNVITHRDVGHRGFLFGQYSREGWWYYFPLAMLIKTPVGSMLLVLASLGFWSLGRRLGWRDAVFLLLPMALFTVALIRGRLNIGLRHALVLYPFLFIFAARAATIRFRQALLAPGLILAAVAFTAFSSLRVAPDQLAYFNELVGGPSHGYRYLVDSNLDWGQDLKKLRAYLEKENVPALYLAYTWDPTPDVYGIRYQWLPGAFHPPKETSLLPRDIQRELLGINVTNLQGVFFEDGGARYGWLLGRTPIAKIGYSIFVYDLSRDADAHMRLADVYTLERQQALAVIEARKALAIEPNHAEALQFLARFR